MNTPLSTSMAILDKSPKRNWFMLIALFLLLGVSWIPGITTAWIGWLTTVSILGILGLSYDLLLGYTGIVSFGHALYFGVGAYVVAVFLNNGGTLPHLIEGVGVGIVAGAILSIGIGYLSLRVKSTYFAMITLAFSQLAYVLARSQGLRSILQGDDGMNLSLPDGLDTKSIYLVAVCALFLTLWMLKQTLESPFGHVLLAVRDNEVRCGAQGYSVLRLKLTSMAISGGFAALSGALFAIAQAFVNPDAVFGLEKSIDPLLMVMIGGAGTLYGALIGAVVIYGAQQVLTSYTQQVPFLEHWMILFGALYILIVLFMPGGILRARIFRFRKLATSTKNRT
jgi:branched-chain amino acid transport system permease protein